MAWVGSGLRQGKPWSRPKRGRHSIVAGRGCNLSGVRGRASCGLAIGRREGAEQGDARARGRALQGREARCLEGAARARLRCKVARQGASRVPLGAARARGRVA